jgi:hypothetical protein
MFNFRYVSNAAQTGRSASLPHTLQSGPAAIGQEHPICFAPILAVLVRDAVLRAKADVVCLQAILVATATRLGAGTKFHPPLLLDGSLKPPVDAVSELLSYPL